MKKLLLLPLIIFMLSCSSDDDKSAWYIHIANYKTLPCKDEIPFEEVFEATEESEKVAQEILIKMNNLAKSNYESGKVSCQYKYTITRTKEGEHITF